MFKPILPVLKIGKRKKAVENLYRIEEGQEASPGEDALRQREPPVNVVVKSVHKKQEIEGGENSDATNTEYREIPPLPEEVMRRKKLMAGAKDLKQENSELSFEIRDEDTIAISVPQLFLFDPGKCGSKKRGEQDFESNSGFPDPEPGVGSRC